MEWFDSPSIQSDNQSSRPSAEPLTEGQRIGLSPERGWARRNCQYVGKRLIPSLLKRRQRRCHSIKPAYPAIGHGEMEVTWIGHASFLVRTPTCNILIDPVWAKWMGPLKRAQDPGLQIDELPKIDVILISHAHFDHLCLRSLRKIADGSQTLIVPKRVKQTVRRVPHAKLIELDAWEKAEYEGTQIHFTPAQHWGARYIGDQDKGFGGFLIEDRGHTLYHSGDSAYFEGFREIGQRFDIDTALLPIGAYNCPSGREVHMNPEEAVTAFFDLGAKQFFPMHHETFPISNEPHAEPMTRLQSAVVDRGIEEQLHAPIAGQQVLIRA